MGLIILLVLLALIFGGSGFYGQTAGWGPSYNYGGFGLGGILVIVVVVLLLRGGI